MICVPPGGPSGPGGPSRPGGVKENPVSPGGPGPARFLWFLGSGLAQPWATAWPWLSVTVRHHVVLHPGILSRGLPALLRLLRGGLDDRAGDRGAQPAGGQPGRPVQHLSLGRSRLVLIEQRGGGGDDPGLAQAQDALAQRGPGPRQVGVQVTGRAHQLIAPGPGFAQGVGDLVRDELRVVGLGVTPVQLGDHGELARGGVGLDPRGGRLDREQLIRRRVFYLRELVRGLCPGRGGGRRSGRMAGLGFREGIAG